MTTLVFDPPDTSTWSLPELDEEGKISDSQMAEAEEKYHESSQISLPSSIQWGGTEAKIITFKGTRQTSSTVIINPGSSVLSVINFAYQNQKLEKLKPLKSLVDKEVRENG